MGPNQVTAVRTSWQGEDNQSSPIYVINYVDNSLIAGAGQGLFLRPDQQGTFYRKNTKMCV